jgi:hypothetical protein
MNWGSQPIELSVLLGFPRNPAKNDLGEEEELTKETGTGGHAS